jgi:hypothetical protein
MRVHIAHPFTRFLYIRQLFLSKVYHFYPEFKPVPKWPPMELKIF